LIPQRQRHRQTDGQTTYYRITALCVASRGKKKQVRMCYVSETVHIIAGN